MSPSCRLYHLASDAPARRALDGRFASVLAQKSGRSASRSQVQRRWCLACIDGRVRGVGGWWDTRIAVWGGGIVPCWRAPRAIGEMLAIAGICPVAATKGRSSSGGGVPQDSGLAAPRAVQSRARHPQAAVAAARDTWPWKRRGSELPPASTRLDRNGSKPRYSAVTWVAGVSRSALCDRPCTHRLCGPESSSRQGVS